MGNKKKWISIAAVVTLTTFALTGCGGTQKADTAKPAPAKERTSIKVGVTAGPHAEVMEVVKKVAAKDGLTIQIVEFNDYMQPNIALNQGEIDANSYQHQPWLDNQVRDRKYELVSIAKTIIFPMGIYSIKIKNLNELKSGASIAVPNDPTNGARALAILEKQGLIKVRSDAGLNATAKDIIDNPLNLKIKELDAAQIPRVMNDVDAAAINTNYAMVAGLVPKKDSIAIEDPKSPYANLLAVRTRDKDDPVFKKLIKAYHSDEVKAYVDDHFKGSVVVVW